MGTDGWDFDVPFCIGFSPNWDALIDVGEAEIAAQAWQEVCNLQRSDEVIRFIRAPDGRILTMRELKKLAENESN
jgi:hypothetical protein